MSMEYDYCTNTWRPTSSNGSTVLIKPEPISDSDFYESLCRPYTTLSDLLLDVYKQMRKTTNSPITNYTYDSVKGVTIIEWCDGTKTVVKAENPDAADKFTGFMTAIAKKAMGNDNTVNKLFDEWTVKKPLKEMEQQKKQQKEKSESERIAKKRAEKKRKWLVRKRAAEIAREYEARKVAEEKYGVPMGLLYPCTLESTSEFDEVIQGKK